MVLRAALNHLLNQRADLRADLARHAGKTGCIRITPFSVDFMIDADGWLVKAGDAPLATVVLAPSLLPRLLLDDASARREVRLEGDAVFAADLARLLQALQWDAEADLARVLGDVPAHLLASRTRQIMGDPRQIVREMAESTAEYLQEEAALLMPRPSVERFVGEVDTLRDDLARLEKRLQRIESKLNTKPPAVTPSP